MKLVQKQFLKGSREFEIIDDVVTVLIKSPFKQEKLTVVLSILNPEPVINGPLLEFHSRVKCSPLLSLLINKPDTAAFESFVDELKRRIHQEFNAFAGLKTGSQPEGLAGNVYDEPPEFDESDKNRNIKPVRLDDIDQSIQMLQQYLKSDDIKPLLTALKALRENPQNELYFNQLASAFDSLGPQQGAILTYAPYVAILLSDDPFDQSNN